jgi:hypothetical protein
MDKPTKEEIEEALAFIDEWGNGGPGSIIAAAYRATREELEETTKSMWKEYARAEMLERQYAQLLGWAVSRDKEEICQSLHLIVSSHAAKREGKS